MSESTLDLEAIRKREQAATEGPWMAATDNGRQKGISLVGRIADRGTGKCIAVFAAADKHRSADSIFTAHARSDVPELLAEVERLRAELAARDGHDRDEDARQGHALNAINGNVRAQYDALAAAVIDLCWRATPFGVDAEGFVDKYLLTTGTVHRLIGAAQCAGISAAFRSPQKIRDDEEARDGHDREQRAAALREAALAIHCCDGPREWYELRDGFTYHAPASNQARDWLCERADRIEASHDE